MTADELQQAKDSLANSLPGAFETSANAVNNFSNVFIYDLGLDYYSRYAAAGERRHRRAGAAVARKYLVPDKLVVIAVGDRAKIESRLRKLEPGPVEIRDAEGKAGEVEGSGLRLRLGRRAVAARPLLGAAGVRA